MIAVMEFVNRKVVYRLYPSATQQRALLDLLGLHQRLYNAALQQRRDAWRLQRKALSAYDQSRDLTELRAADSQYAQLNAQSAQVTLQRLHLAFAGFFRRLKAGETAGFPRLKSFDRFSGWGYNTATSTASCGSPGWERFPSAGAREPPAGNGGHDLTP